MLQIGGEKNFFSVLDNFSSRSLYKINNRFAKKSPSFKKTRIFVLCLMLRQALPTDQSRKNQRSSSKARRRNPQK